MKSITISKKDGVFTMVDGTKSVTLTPQDFTANGETFKTLKLPTNSANRQWCKCSFVEKTGSVTLNFKATQQREVDPEVAKRRLEEAIALVKAAGYTVAKAEPKKDKVVK